MEEQFILRVPPSVAERIEHLLNNNNNNSDAPSSSSEDNKSLDLSFSEDGRSGSFLIGNERFAASLLDLPCVVESFKTYDDSSLIKTADIAQPELVSRVEKDLLKIMARGNVDNLDVEIADQEEGDEIAGGPAEKPAPAPAPVPKHDVPVTHTNAVEQDRSDSDESDDSV
ncbi:PREDICTED: transcription initiation factor TFIID subunit 7 isoform X2 [Lupinus angustifolius]|uniref:transcription initiation factor TFIID subunit 7 isoform X2 n=1 Tax=Lupinus angustifolius TaxID=3871 RepID=UPI00092F0E2D|nr:PREDICTED: transcription initiation factor TFIID subunit 7 isoform X2 [Lupinus angustifolius]